MSSFHAAVSPSLGEITKFNFPGKNIVGGHQHLGLVKNTEREHSENHYPKSVPCPTSTCAESIPEKCNSKEVQPMHQSRCIVQSPENFTVNVQQSSFASSIEETPHRDQPVNDVKCHDRCSGNPWQQACVHSQYTDPDSKIPPSWRRLCNKLMV